MTFEHITVGGVVVLSLLLVLTNFYMVGRYATKRETTVIDAKIGVLSERCTALTEKLATLENRLSACERDASTPPSRHELHTDVGKLVAAMAGVVASLEGVQRQVGTNNDLLRAVIETGGGR